MKRSKQLHNFNLSADGLSWGRIKFLSSMNVDPVHALPPATQSSNSIQDHLVDHVDECENLSGERSSDGSRRKLQLRERTTSSSLSPSPVTEDRYGKKVQVTGDDDDDGISATRKKLLMEYQMEIEKMHKSILQKNTPEEEIAPIRAFGSPNEDELDTKSKGKLTSRTRRKLQLPPRTTSSPPSPFPSPATDDRSGMKVVSRVDDDDDEYQVEIEKMHKLILQQNTSDEEIAPIRASGSPNECKGNLTSNGDEVDAATSVKKSTRTRRKLQVRPRRTSSSPSPETDDKSGKKVVSGDDDDDNDEYLQVEIEKMHKSIQQKKNTSVKKSTRTRRNLDKKDATPRFSISLSWNEIKEDFIAMTGKKPPRKPNRRSKSDQMKIDNLCPGLRLNEVHPDRYKVKETKRK